MTACAPPKRKLCPLKQGLCPEEINRLGATGVQIEAWDSQNSAYCCRIREQELFFSNFCVDSHRISWNIAYILGRRLFFLSSPQNSWTIGQFLRWKPELVDIFGLKTFFFGLYLFWFDPHSWILINKVLVPPQNLFMPPPPSHAILAPGLQSVTKR